MFYVEMQLDGKVKISFLSDHILMWRVQLEAMASCLPQPGNVADAHEYLRANCFQFEMFETLDHLANWAEHYAGFRAGEVRAELARFEARWVGYYANDLVLVAA
jgi:hypothetical protein